MLRQDPVHFFAPRPAGRPSPNSTNAAGVAGHKLGLRKIGKPGSSPFPGDAQNGPETTQLWRKFAPIVRVSVGFACGAGGLACGAS